MTPRTRTTRRSSRRGVAAAAQRAFTLVELLVVISVMAVVMIIVLPAIARVLESANYANAVNAVTATLTRVSERGVDGGVAVLFDPHTQRTTLVPLELHARNAQLTPNPARAAVAYRPAAGLAPVNLPVGMAVYGLSFSHDPDDTSAIGAPTRRDQAWYLGERTAGSAGADLVLNNWLFPRNHPQFFLRDYNPNDLDDPNHPTSTAPPPGNINADDANHPLRSAESFFIPFTADGRAPGSALFAGGVYDAYIEFPDLPRVPAGESHNVAANERSNAFDPERYFPGNANHSPSFNPEVHIRPADRLAIVDLNRLIADTGIRAPWFVRTDNHVGYGTSMLPVTPTDKQDYSDEDLVRRVSEWIDIHGEVVSVSPNTGKVARRK